MKHLWLLLAMTFSLDATAAIGSVTGVQGTVAEINRNKTLIPGKINTGVESMDTVSVGSKTNLDITFKDDTKVKITENSRLILDDFVYDPKKSDAGKLGMKVALGTVRYASGQVAKNNPQNVNIKTPTATIAVRGTDFAMTVDEVGRSLVVLLPSCDDPTKLNNFQIQGNCVVGVIDVSTDAGFVTLTQAYTATYVTDSQQPPLPPVAVDPIAVGNDSNLRKPESIARVENDRNVRKEVERNKSSFNEDERKVSKDSTEKNLTVGAGSQAHSETVLLSSNTEIKTEESSKSSNCQPFNECGNEKGLNWYYRRDENRGNTIMIRSGEKFDNTTYSISINSTEMETRVVGDGSNKVTIRIWNK